MLPGRFSPELEKQTSPLPPGYEFSGRVSVYGLAGGIFTPSFGNMGDVKSLLPNNANKISQVEERDICFWKKLLLLFIKLIRDFTSHSFYS